jgi:hypothetical protein
MAWGSPGAVYYVLPNQEPHDAIFTRTTFMLFTLFTHRTIEYPFCDDDSPFALSDSRPVSAVSKQ